MTDIQPTGGDAVRTGGTLEDRVRDLERRMNLLEMGDHVRSNRIRKHLSEALAFRKVVVRFSEVTILGFAMIGALNVVGLLMDVFR